MNGCGEQSIKKQRTEAESDSAKCRVASVSIHIAYWNCGNCGKAFTLHVEMSGSPWSGALTYIERLAFNYESLTAE